MKVVGEKYDYSKQVLADSPTYVLLEPTNRCNLRCPTCSRETLSRFGSMSFADFKTIMDQMPDLKTVKLHGLGEAFLSKEIPAMLDYLYARNVETIVVTNGNWRSVDFEHVLSRSRFLYFSIDGFDKETYEAARPGGNWETVVNNVKKFTELKDKYDCKIIVNFVCHSQNPHYMPKMVELCNELNVDALRINVMQSWVSEQDYPEKFQEFKKLFLNDLETFVFYYKEALKLGCLYNFDVEAIGNETFSFNQCLWTFERTYITWEGEMVPCCMRPDPKYSAGNILSSSLKEVWHSDGLNKIRHRLQENQPFDFCKDCPYKGNAAFLKEVKSKILLDQDFAFHEALSNLSVNILRNIKYVGQI